MLSNVWQEAVARPDDDGIRSVLADALQARGLALGELMALQLLPADPELAPERRARIRALVQAGYAEWLGPLVEITCGARFERGFASRVELASAPRWQPDDPRWAFDTSVVGQIREIALQRYQDAPTHATFDRLVTSEKLTALRAVEIDRVEDVLAIERSPARLAHVAILRLSEEDLAVLERLIPVVRTRHLITELSINAWMFEEIAPLPWFERLTLLGVAGGVRKLLELWPRLPSHTTLLITPRPGLDTCERAFPDDYRIELRRDGSARIGGEWLMYPLEVLRELPREIVRLEIEDTSEPIALRIREALRDRAIEIVVLGDDGRAGNVTWR